MFELRNPFFDLVTPVIISLAVWRAWTIFFAGRRQWAISDWFHATFWIALLLATMWIGA